MTITRADVEAWYELQRDTRDIINANDGVNNGASITSDSPFSNLIGSHSFDGTNDYINTTLNYSDGNSFSVSTWVKFNILENDRYIAAAREGSTVNDDSFFFGLDNGNLRFGSRDGTNNVNYVVTYPYSNLATNQWYHIVGTYSTSNGYKLYVGGVEVASNFDTTYFSQTRNIPIGCYNQQGSTINFFSGNISQFSVFNKALTSTEVSTLYNSGNGKTARELFPLTDNLEAYYKLDGDATDATGNGNDGTVNGATVTSPGRIGDAYSFDGNDKIEISDNSTWEISETGSWAFGFWAKTTDTGNVVIWEKNGNSGWSIQQEGDNTIKMKLGGTDDADQLQTNTSINDGNWHHVVFTLDNGTGRVYIDGEDKTTSQPGGATPTYGTEPTYIGSRNTSVGFVGDLDEMFFRTESMTQGEARRLYSYGAGLRYEDLDKENPLNDGVVGAWTFDSLEGAKNNTYPLQNNGATQTTGKLSDAYDTQGSTSTYLKTQDNIGVSGSEARTLATWFNLQAVNDDKGHIVNWGNTGVGGESYGFFHLNAPDNNLNFFGWGKTEDYDTNYDIPTDEWVNAVATYDGSTVETYTNGTETAVSNQSRSLNTLDTEVFFGQRMDVQSASHFDGLIDFSCVWSRDLAVTEVNEFDNDGNGQQFPYGLQTSITAITQSFNYQFTPQAITALPGTTAQPLDYTYTAQPSTISIITTASPFNYRYYQAVEPVRLFGAAGNIIITGRNT